MNIINPTLLSQYRSHFDKTYGQGANPYEYYQSAYEFGARQGDNHDIDTSYASRAWHDEQLRLRQAWESEETNTMWDDVKDAIQHGWETARAALVGEK